MYIEWLLKIMKIFDCSHGYGDVVTGGQRFDYIKRMALLGQEIIDINSQVHILLI